MRNFGDEMITPKEAEKLAQKTMQDYVEQCKCNNNEDVANVLMKLVSMCGLGMCAVSGQEDAVSRLQGTTNYIAKTQEGKNWVRQPVNRVPF